ncbi:acyltransferase family protein [Mucilaginibacter sp. 22184]|uniref:acyltransferase family protein n=1 Tax=Mucilaginibacter sp. 22184 TaxID=3453887 RepID=UPI003F826889
MGKTTIAETVNNEAPVNRIASVDVYRGFVMLLMMAEVVSFESVAKALPDNRFWQILAFNQSHVPWTWLSLHDMIQPSFTFLVGVVLPYSVASRKKKGATFNSIIGHTLFRSLVLIFLGFFLRSLGSDHTVFTFEDTLTQIGLGYTFLVMLGFCSPKIQLGVLIFILVGYWLAFALYPLPGAGFDYASAGVPPNWEHNLHGFAAHWNKNTNLAWAADRWFLNLLPRSQPFLFNEGGYSTLSFIPTLGTMILGLLAGGVLKNSQTGKEKLKYFIIAGGSLIALGILLQLTNINPIVKRIWTPAWVVFSGGICFGFLALFYWLVDLKQIQKPFFFLTVIGVNSIAAYVMADGGLRRYISENLHTHLGQHYDQLFGIAYTTLVSGGLTLFFLWLILYWMYRRKIFIKI